MQNLTSGLIAGFAGTVLMSAMMVMKAMMGVMPELNAISMMATMAHDRTGMATGPVFGWLMHFMIGTVLWGGVFGLIQEKLPGSSVVSGLVLASGAWLLMMVMVMPMAGAGLFGLTFGPMAPMATLMMHMVYGATLGFVFGKLTTAGASGAVAAE